MYYSINQIILNLTNSAHVDVHENLYKVEELFNVNLNYYLVVDFLEVIVQVNFVGILLAAAVTDVLLEALVNHLHVATPVNAQQHF